MTTKNATDVVIVEAARRFVAAERRAVEANGRDALDASIAYDDAFHTLRVAVNGACRQCDDGTCPIVDTPAL